MSKNTLLSELINYVSANSSGNVTIAAPSSGLALDVSGSGNFTGQLTLGSTITNGTYTYTLPGATGTLALTSDIPTGTISGTGTSGQVTFFNGTSSVTGDSGFVWDNTNKRLGVGTTPDVQFQVLSTLRIGKNAVSNSTLELASTQGPITSFSQAGDNLTISNNSGASITSIIFANKLRTLRFTSNIGGTFYVPRANQGTLATNVNGFLVENQTTTNSNGTATFISTDGSGSIIRSTSFGGTGVSSDIQFQFGGGANPADLTITTPVIFKKSGNVLIGTTADAGFKLDISGTARVSSSLTANSFVKTSGTSTEFLKADGSVDSSTYLTTGTASSTYLPLSGGTLTGALGGTSATFSSTITSLASSGQATIIAEGSATSGEGAIQVKGKNSSGTSRTAQIKYDNSDVIRIGTSSAIGMQFETSDTPRMYITSNGNVGIGVTALGSWDTTIKAIEIGTTGNFYGGYNGGASVIYLGANAYYNSGWKYATSSAYKAQLLDAGGGNWHFQNAAAGTAGGAITWTSLMKIADTGQVGIGTTSPYSKLTIHSTASSTLGLNAQSGLVLGQGGATNDLVQIGFNQSVSSTYSPAAISYLITNSGASTLGDILFSTRTSISDVAPSERMRITSGGFVGIGTTPHSNWYSTWKVLQIGATTNIHNTGTADNSTRIANNGYYSSSDAWTYSVSSVAPSMINLESGGDIVFLNAASGTAGGTFSWNNRMRITSGGDLLVGTTTDVGQRMRIEWAGGAGKWGIKMDTSDGGAANLIEFLTGGSVRGSITTNGTSVAYNTTSDYRLKEDLKPINGLEIVNKIKVYDYKWKSDNSRMDGVLAHELAEVLPYAVQGIKDGEQMQSVDYSKIVPVMVQAIKDLKAELDKISGKV